MPREVSTDSAIDIQHLLRWPICNVLAGNSDGHAKNLSLLYLPDSEIRIAPFYDLVCTRAMDRIDHRLAFAVGDQSAPGLITAKHWDRLALACDIGPRFLHKLLKETASSLLERLGEARERFEARYGDYRPPRRIDRLVRRQCSRVS